jgi:hypothetical protein
VVGAVAGFTIFVRVFMVRLFWVWLFWQRLRRHAVRSVHPLRQVLELAALAAERLPRRLDRVATTEHAGTRGHEHIL